MVTTTRSGSLARKPAEYSAYGCVCGAPEQWRPFFVPGYEASSHGRVRRNGSILGQYPHSRGYLVVMVLIDGVSRRRTVHRLVAAAFPRGAGEQVDHLDGNKTHNCAGNLEFVSAAENLRRAIAAGRFNTGRACAKCREVGHYVTTCTRRSRAPYPVGPLPSGRQLRAAFKGTVRAFARALRERA